MPYQSYPKSLVNQNEIPIEFIMSLTSMKMLTNMAHLQYRPR